MPAPLDPFDTPLEFNHLVGTRALEIFAGSVTAIGGCLVVLIPFGADADGIDTMNRERLKVAGDPEGVMTLAEWLGRNK